MPSHTSALNIQVNDTDGSGDDRVTQLLEIPGQKVASPVAHRPTF